MRVLILSITVLLASCNLPSVYTGTQIKIAGDNGYDRGYKTCVRHFESGKLIFPQYEEYEKAKTTARNKK